MKKIYKIIITGALILLGGCATLQPKPTNLKIMSFNVRCGVCEDEKDPNHWSKRKILAAKILDTEKPDIISTQETEDYQAEDMAKATGFAYYGIGREEGETGERNAVLWNPNRFEALKTQTIWLNASFKKFEKGWDAAWVRTLTMIEFQDKNTKKIFWVFDAHLDNEGTIARAQSAKIILDKIRERSPAPVVLMGDLNDVVNSESYKILASKLKPISKYEKDDFTFNGFGKDMTKGKAIDHFFANFDAAPQNFKIIQTSFDGLYPSDHFPIVADIKIK